MAWCGRHHQHADERDSGGRHDGEPIGGHASVTDRDRHRAVGPLAAAKRVRAGARRGGEFQRSPPDFSVRRPRSRIRRSPPVLAHAVAAWSTAQAAVSSPVINVNPGGSPATDPEVFDGLIPSRPRAGVVSDAVLDELATDSVLWPSQQGNGPMTIPVLSTDRVSLDRATGDPFSQRDRPLPSVDSAAGLAVLGLAAGVWARGTGLADARKRQTGRVFRKDEANRAITAAWGIGSDSKKLRA